MGLSFSPYNILWFYLFIIQTQKSVLQSGHIWNCTSWWIQHPEFKYVLQFQLHVKTNCSVNSQRPRKDHLIGRLGSGVRPSHFWDLSSAERPCLISLASSGTCSSTKVLTNPNCNQTLPSFRPLFQGLCQGQYIYYPSNHNHQLRYYTEGKTNTHKCKGTHHIVGEVAQLRFSDWPCTTMKLFSTATTNS